MRGGIFALFTSSPGEDPAPIGHVFGAEGGTFVEPLAEPVPHEVAAADATAAAGRLFALERAGELTVARSIADVDGALAEGAPPVAVLHIEGAEAIDPGLEALPAWYAMGLRSLGPVWSRANAFATGVQFVFPSSPDIGPGLTDAGVALVRACAELGILVDLSHLNEKGFWDVARLEPGPLVASHSGAHAVAAASRNLTDAQLDAIGATGGLVGIVYATAFIRADFADDPDTPLSDDRRPRPLRRRPDRGRARRPRLRLRRRHDPRPARRRRRPAEAARRPPRGRLQRARARADRLVTTGAASSTPGGADGVDGPKTPIWQVFGPSTVGAWRGRSRRRRSTSAGASAKGQWPLWGRTLTSAAGKNSRWRSA